MQSLDEAYSEVVHWQNNIFNVPLENAGKSFVAELSRLYRAYADGSALEAIALKACTVMSVLLLQRPFRSSKSKDHSHLHVREETHADLAEEQHQESARRRMCSTISPAQLISIKQR